MTAQTGKKRGRKPKKNIKIPEEYFTKKEVIETEENIILMLPLSVLEPNDINSTYPNGIIDDSYYSLDGNKNTSPIFININNIITDSNNELNVKTETEIETENENENEQTFKNKIEEYKEQRKDELVKSKIDDNNTSIFLDFINANKSGCWPSSTNIDCLWCTYSFENSPVGLPIKKDGDRFVMFGNFCSTGCSAAYNFDKNDSQFEIWERFTLLNYIYGNGNNSIKISPPRLALKKFGGKLTIDEFRKIQNNKDIDYEVVLPPMRSIIPTLEEITIDSNKDYMQGFETDMLHKTNTELRLKRSKPLPSAHNTLESCMNLQYV